ncbi:SLATT domain-containing protein [Mesorhizobium sp. M0142]
MADTPDGNVDDRIWITSRTRMISERKALRRQNYSYLLLTYYSLFVVVISAFSEYYRNYYKLFDSINISASVVVLAASLVVAGFRFEAAAMVFRDCY